MCVSAYFIPANEQTGFLSSGFLSWEVKHEISVSINLHWAFFIYLRYFYFCSWIIISYILLRFSWQISLLPGQGHDGGVKREDSDRDVTCLIRMGLCLWRIAAPPNHSLSVPFLGSTPSCTWPAGTARPPDRHGWYILTWMHGSESSVSLSPDGVLSGERAWLQDCSSRDMFITPLYLLC